MLPQRNNPIADWQQDRRLSFFLICTVVGHDAAASVEGFLWKAYNRFPFREVVVGIFICDHVHRVLQDCFDGKTSEVLTLPRFNPAAEQFRFHSSQ